MRPKVARLADWLGRDGRSPARRRRPPSRPDRGGRAGGRQGDEAAFPWDRQLGAEVCRRARGHGLFIRPLGDVLVIMPPLAITLEQLDEMLAIIRRSLDEVTP